MKKDVDWNVFFEDNERFADFVNAVVGLEADEKIKGSEIATMESRLPSANKTSKYMDSVRKIIRGLNFIIVDIENQETVDYGYPLRDLSYVNAEYERQARAIKRNNKESLSIGRNSGEYLYSFSRDDKLKPTVIFLLYSGVDEWDGPKSIYDMLEMENVPEAFVPYIQNHEINLIDLHRMDETELDKYGEAVSCVFKLIRFSEEKNKLLNIVQNDERYHHMDSDTAAVAAHYIHDKRIARLIEQQIDNKEEKVDMCKAIDDLINDGIEQGIEQGKRIIIKDALNSGKTPEDIALLLNLDIEYVTMIQAMK